MEKSKIPIADKWRILDFSEDSITFLTYNFLQYFARYADLINDEHLISLHNAHEEASGGGHIWQYDVATQDIILQELTALKKHTDRNDAFYIRFIHYPL